MPALKEALKKRMPSCNEAGHRLHVQADARPGGSGQGFTTVYADVVGTVTNPRGKPQYQNPDVGWRIQLDLPRATNAVYGMASKRQPDTFVPGLIRVWHGL